MKDREQTKEKSWNGKIKNNQNTDTRIRLKQMTEFKYQFIKIGSKQRWHKKEN